MVDPNEDALTLVDPRPEAWHEAFAAERERIRTALAAAELTDRVERIEHVGSTAVPGLAAKDIVDLDVVVADDAVREVADASQAALGGTRYENSATWHPVFRNHDSQRFNVHVFAVSDDGWRKSVATREVLRERADLRAEYEALKRDLAGDTNDLEAYSRGKTELLERVLDVARAGDEVSLDFEVPAASE
jgi:GrpB-like predicted nucleotidyltransferase (UPF0157 family)